MLGRFENVRAWHYKFLYFVDSGRIGVDEGQEQGEGKILRCDHVSHMHHKLCQEGEDYDVGVSKIGYQSDGHGNVAVGGVTGWRPRLLN